MKLCQYHPSDILKENPINNKSHQDFSMGAYVFRLFMPLLCEPYAELC